MADPLERHGGVLPRQLAGAVRGDNFHSAGGVVLASLEPGYGDCSEPTLVMGWRHLASELSDSIGGCRGAALLFLCPKTAGHRAEICSDLYVQRGAVFV